MSKVDFHKHLFLFTRLQRDPSFDFVPYKFGCYSMQAEADRLPLVRQGLLSDGTLWRKQGHTDYVKTLTPDDRAAVIQHKRDYEHLRGHDLLRHVYLEYPYYAINSTIARDILDHDELGRVQEARPRSGEIVLYTIGYEGKTIERYLNQLIEADVRVLCDVRNNPLSRKFGFSKRSLQAAVEKMGILYQHIPELGIDSSKRRALRSRRDYDRLFNEYEREILPHCNAQLDSLHTLIEEHERVALTCFELRSEQCHRSRVASALKERPGWTYSVQHLQMSSGNGSL